MAIEYTHQLMETIKINVNATLKINVNATSGHCIGQSSKIPILV